MGLFSAQTLGEILGPDVMQRVDARIEEARSVPLTPGEIHQILAAASGQIWDTLGQWFTQAQEKYRQDVDAKFVSFAKTIGPQVKKFVGEQIEKSKQEILADCRRSIEDLRSKAVPGEQPVSDIRYEPPQDSATIAELREAIAQRDKTLISTMRLVCELERRLANIEAKGTLEYLGVWEPDREYMPNSVVTQSGSLFCARTATRVKPGSGDEGRDWQLCVKRGKDGDSIFDLAKKNGFKGNERDFLASLKPTPTGTAEPRR